MQRFKNRYLLAFVMTMTLAMLGISGAPAQTYTDIHDFDIHPTWRHNQQYPGMLARAATGTSYRHSSVGWELPAECGVFRIPRLTARIPYF